MSGSVTAVAVLIEPAPYMVRLLEQLQKQCTGTVHGIFVNAALTQPWSSVSSKNSYDVLPSARSRAFWKLLTTIIRINPSVVFVAGWSNPLIVAAIVIARLRGACVVSMSDTWTSNSRGARTLLKRQVLQLIHAFAPGGTRQAKYLKEQGISTSRINISCMTSDTSAIKAFTASRGADRASLRADRWSVDDAIVFVFVGRLEPVKGPDLLIQAFARTKADANVRLVVIGDGVMRDVVANAAELDSRIVYKGRLDGANLWAELAAADVLVVPSRSESWGLVVNEAMSSGLAVLASDCCGCIDDLIIHGKTGIIVPTENVAALQAAIDELASNPELVLSLRRSAKEHAQRWTTEAWAANILATWHTALAGMTQPRRKED